MNATLDRAGVDAGMKQQLVKIQMLMAGALRATSLAKLTQEGGQFLNTGKMLRSRLLLRVGAAAGTPEDVLLHAAAAVEMIHAASLLHDDVIDGGFVRRNLPTFWVERGVNGAILAGDLMLFKALELAGHVDDGRLVRELVRMTGEVCDAESEQELVLRGSTPSWENCMMIARKKTGALFAFAAFAAAGQDTSLASVLRESGYAIGTAYQLADDILDAVGTEGDSGKTLGTDEARLKTTAVSAGEISGKDPIEQIEQLLQRAEDALLEWPEVHRAWRHFNDADFRPAIDKFLNAYAAC